MMEKLRCPVFGIALGMSLSLLLPGGAVAGTFVGWVMADRLNATSDYTPDPLRSYNSRLRNVRISPLGNGFYLARFKNLYHGKPDNVQVTAYNSNGYCVSSGWGAGGTEVYAYAQCYDAAGNPANSRFTLLYQARTSGLRSSRGAIALLWADQPGAASYTPSLLYQYNSTGGTNTVIRNGTGSYVATLPGLTRTGGDAQVTAENANARCKVGGWGNDAEATNVRVVCFDVTGQPVDAQFSFAFALKAPLSVGTRTNGVYVRTNRPRDTGTYTPENIYNYDGYGTGKLTAQRTALGRYTVNIPGNIGSYGTSNALATGANFDARYCNVLSWQTQTINIGCYKPGGTPADAEFDLAFQTAN